MKKKICLVSLWIIFVNTGFQQANAGTYKWLPLIPALVSYGIFSYRNPEHRFVPRPIRAFVPESYLRELNAPMSEDRLMPPRNPDFEAQGSWEELSEPNELAIDCRSGKPDTCFLYWNCPSCYRPLESREYYKGQAKKKLGEIRRTARYLRADGHFQETYSGIIYHPEKFIKGGLEKVKARILIQGHVHNIKLWCYDRKTEDRVFYIRWRRSYKSLKNSPDEQWSETPSYIK